MMGIVGEGIQKSLAVGWISDLYKYIRGSKYIHNHLVFNVYIIQYSYIHYITYKDLIF